MSSDLMQWLGATPSGRRPDPEDRLGRLREERGSGRFGGRQPQRLDPDDLERLLEQFAPPEPAGPPPLHMDLNNTPFNYGGGTGMGPDGPVADYRGPSSRHERELDEDSWRGWGDSWFRSPGLLQAGGRRVV